MTNSNTTPYEAFKTEVWSQKINSGLDKTCVMLQCVNRDYQADADKGTAAINIITPNEVAVGTYTGSIDSYGEAMAEKLQLKLNQSVYFGFSVPDIEEAQSNASIMDTITNKAKKAVEASIDAHLFSQYVNADADNILGQTSSPLAISKTNVYENFVKLAKVLKSSGAITAEKQGWVVVHPDVEEKLLLCPEFVSGATVGEKTLREGAIGRIAGLDVLVSSNVGKNSDHYVALAGTNEAITYASQITKVETLRAASSFDSIVRGLYTYGALTINPKALASCLLTLAE